MSLDFTPEERAIFQYHNGLEVVYADPLEIRQRLRYTLPNSALLLRQSISARKILQDNAKLYDADPDHDHPYTEDEENAIRIGAGAEEKLILGSRDVFGMPAIDAATGAGVPGAMVLKVWNSFQQFMEKKSGTQQAEQTSAPPSTVPSSTTQAESPIQESV